MHKLWQSKIESVNYLYTNLQYETFEKALQEAAKTNFDIFLPKEINNLIIEYTKGANFITRLFKIIEISARLFFKCRLDKIIYMRASYCFFTYHYDILFIFSLFSLPYVFKFSSYEYYLQYICIYTIWSIALFLYALCLIYVPDYFWPDLLPISALSSMEIACFCALYGLVCSFLFMCLDLI